MYLNIYDDFEDSPKASFQEIGEINHPSNFPSNDSLAVSKPIEKPADASDDGIEYENLRSKTYILE